ncbi:phosphoglycerate kinase [soil metagenome]
MKYIDEVEITNKRVLLRVDFNISLDSRHHIANDERIRQSLPTIKYLLKKHNTIILLSHLGRPLGENKSLTLEPIAERLKKLLDNVEVVFVSDLDHLPMEITRTGNLNRVLLLENIRFYKGEETNDPSFAKKLANLGDVYVNDAFSVSHRSSASVVGITKYLPSFGGLLLKKEVETISSAIKDPKHPFIAILGGAKISTKIHLITKLIDIADFILLGGGLANTFLLALKDQVGQSLVEKNEVTQALQIIELAKQKRTKLLLPSDVIVGGKDGRHAVVKLIQKLSPHDRIFDIGIETQAIYAQAILQAKTIIWNGPMGLFEVDAYKRGTDFIYYAITANDKAVSIVGGGETLAALTNKDHLEKITHISTGGGAMLEFIENGTLPGIDALNKSES